MRFKRPSGYHESCKSSFWKVVSLEGDEPERRVFGMRTKAALTLPAGRSLIGLAIEDEDMAGSVEAVLEPAEQYDIKRFSETEIKSGVWPPGTFGSIVASSSAIRQYRRNLRNKLHRKRPIIVILNSTEIPDNRDNIIYSDSFVLYDYNIARLPSLILICRHRLAIMPPVRGHGPSGISRKISQLNKLPEREREVLAELGRGTGNRQIATHLNLTVSMVKDRVRQILGQLGFRNRTDAGLFAAAYLFDDPGPRTPFDEE